MQVKSWLSELSTASKDSSSDGAIKPSWLDDELIKDRLVGPSTSTSHHLTSLTWWIVNANQTKENGVDPGTRLHHLLFMENYPSKYWSWAPGFLIRDYNTGPTPAHLPHHTLLAGTIWDLSSLQTRQQLESVNLKVGLWWYEIGMYLACRGKGDMQAVLCCQYTAGQSPTPCLLKWGQGEIADKQYLDDIFTRNTHDTYVLIATSRRSHRGPEQS